MNKSRKHKLHQRADQYAVHASNQEGRTHWGLAYNGYLDGYKAAMRDMRKEINKPLTPEEESEGACMEMWIADRAEQFLRPIR